MALSTTTLLSAAAYAAAAICGTTSASLVVLLPIPTTIPVQFNPSEYKITYQAKYAEKERPKNDNPVVSFGGSPMSKLALRLYFDGESDYSDENLSGIANSKYKEKDITKALGKISNLTRIVGSTHMPSPVVFIWGSMKYVGYVDNVSVAYTMFDKEGKPLRAVAEVSIMGFNADIGERVSPFMSPDRTKARTLTEDTNILNIAQNEYGDSREWRRIADANGIIDPLDIPVGQILKVPSIND